MNWMQDSKSTGSALLHAGVVLCPTFSVTARILLGGILAWATNCSAVPALVVAPEFTKLSQSSQHVNIDVRSYWQASVVGVNNLAPQQATEPELLWSTPDAEFQPASTSGRLLLNNNQRYVARLNMQSPGYGASFHLVFKQPRLDAVHVAYRYDQEPWVKAQAGDTIAMQLWTNSNVQPSFEIPTRPGNLNVVAEIAHQGVVGFPVVLQSASTFSEERMSGGLQLGLLMGLNCLMALIGVAATVSFRRVSFLAITIMSFLMAAVLATNSGMAGVYIATDSPIFNDESKFLTASVWAALFPWVTAIALSQRLNAPKLWVLSLLWAVLCIGLGWWWSPSDVRGQYLQYFPAMATASLALSLVLLIYAFMRQQVYALATTPPVLLYGAALMVPLLGYVGYLPNTDVVMVAAVLTWVSAMLFLQVLMRQHRQGRMVMTRAKSSPGRDVLTGLLSRKGFDQVLSRDVERMKADRGSAVFIYIRVTEASKLAERYGADGFETGMVQMAAAISSCLSMVDHVGRVAPNAFAVVVQMPRDANTANRLSQKILSRVMALANHGAPMADTARIASAWIPVFGEMLPELERRSIRALRKLDDGKRITWVGGTHAHNETSQQPLEHSSATSKPHNSLQADDALPSLPGMINRLELEMLGPSTEQLQAEADKMLRLMKDQAILTPIKAAV